MPLLCCCAFVVKERVRAAGKSVARARSAATCRKERVRINVFLPLIVIARDVCLSSTSGEQRILL